MQPQKLVRPYPKCKGNAVVTCGQSCQMMNLNQSAQEFQEQTQPDPRAKGDRHVSGIAEDLLYGCTWVWLVCHDYHLLYHVTGFIFFGRSFFGRIFICF